MDTRNVLEEKMLALPKASQVVDMLLAADNLDVISDNDNINDVILDFTKKMTNAFNFSKHPLTYKQLQAIAYLPAISIHHYLNLIMLITRTATF